MDMNRFGLTTAFLVGTWMASAALVREYERIDGAEDAPLPGVAVRTDMFADDALWLKPDLFRAGSLKMTRTGGTLTVAGQIATNRYDTAWQLASRPMPLTTKGLGYVLSFGITATPRLGRTGGSARYSCAVVWHGADGKVVARDPFMLRSRLGGRRRAVLLGSVPAAAETFSVQFGFDRPDLFKGQSVALDALALHVMEHETDPAWRSVPDPEAPRIRVVSESPFQDPNAELRISVTSRRTIDWASLKIAVDGKEATAAFRRDGDVLTYAPPAPWTPGLHRATVTLVDPDEGAPFTAQKAFFRGEAPKGGPHVTLRDDGVTLVDGKPFFPIGIYGVMKREFNGFDFDRGLKDLAAGGFNLVHSYAAGRTKEFLDAAHRNGLKAWTGETLPNAHFVDVLRHHPAVIAWYVGDDTAMHHTPSEIYDRVDSIRAVDPTRITVQADVMNSGDAVSSYRAFVKVTDAFLPEIYPVHEPKPVSAELCVARTVRDMKRFREDVAEAGDGAPRAVWPIIQYFRGWTSWKRFPTREELFAMSFASLANGAHGITWYTYGGTVEPKKKKDNHGITDTPEIWGNMTNLACRIRTLAPALLARTPPQPPPAKILAGPAKDGLGNAAISQLVKRQGDTYYVIMVNGTLQEITAELDVGLPAADAEVMWENRRVKLAEGRLTDRFAPLAVHVYRIANPLEYVGHQGEEALAPNHSLAAYRLAAQHGLDYLKLDVRETKDGHVVLQHDDTLKAVMGWNVKIKNVTLEEIRAKGRCRPRGGYTNETISTLPEALEIAKGMRGGVWIDFKHFTPAFAEKVFAQLDAAGFGPDRVKVATFSKPALRWVQQNRPAVRRVAHTFIRRMADGTFDTNACEKGRVNCATVEALGDALEAHAREFGLHGFNLSHIFRKGKMLYQTPPAIIARLRRAGYWLSIWFAYDPATAEYYRTAGASAFVTNWKERTFADFDPALAQRVRLMRLMARIPMTVKDAGEGKRAEAMFFCNWEPVLAAKALEEAGGDPQTPEEAFELLVKNCPALPEGSRK